MQYSISIQLVDQIEFAPFRAKSSPEYQPNYTLVGMDGFPVGDAPGRSQ